MSRYKLFLSALFLFLSACSSDVFLVHTGNMPSDDKIAQVKVGQTQDDVRQILGSPSAVTALDENEWLYMSSTLKKVAFCTPKIVDRDVLAIRFDKKGQVEKISRLNKDDGHEIKPDSDQTSSGGHNPGFFKKYFGGVGTYMPIGPSKEK
ncbi:MAG: outer membrane protein assembly factor BamE [Alphaproteobacteria bacterium]|nr:outer membrane protein assembly factor BamE [Alphaproteobacteria bacterium]